MGQASLFRKTLGADFPVWAVQAIVRSKRASKVKGRSFAAKFNNYFLGETIKEFLTSFMFMLASSI